MHGSCHSGKFHCIWQHSQTRLVLSLSLYNSSSRPENAANTIRYSAVAHLKEPFVSIPFRHRPGWLLYTRRSCLSSNFFRCFGGETRPSTQGARVCRLSKVRRLDIFHFHTRENLSLYLKPVSLLRRVQVCLRGPCLIFRFPRISLGCCRRRNKILFFRSIEAPV